MFSKVVNAFLLMTLLFCLTLIATPVAAKTYGSLESRVYQNQIMIDAANKMSSSTRLSYTDKYLRDLAQTGYNGVSKSQQDRIQNIADKTILKDNKNAYTVEEKLLAFYDWIIENYYYYENPNKIYALNSSGKNYDNPYYLITYEYDVNGKVRARSNGYAATLIALARSQGIPARQVGGYYNKNARGNYTNWGSNINKTIVNHLWVQAYVNGSWVMLDPVADCYQVYNEKTKEYIVEAPNTDEAYINNYFNPDISTLSKSHISFSYYPGSKEVKYLTSSYEKTKITRFLNKKYRNKTNGKKINSLYSVNKPETWFTKTDKNSKGDGLGRIQKIYWSSKNLYGSLDLGGFPALKTISIYNNKVSSLSLSNCPKIQYVYAASNKLTKMVVTGSRSLATLSARNNPTTYIKYNFGKTKRTAIIKATKGGTVSVKYTKISTGKHIHSMKAVAKQGYTFKGWYSNGKRVSKSASIAPNKTFSFAYTAKFVKKSNKTYILVSIKKQKLWYYKNGVLKKTSSVVTGTKGKHDTPKGTYKILGKARSVYLIGPDYRSWVDFWILIDRRNQIGLHDASWRWNFGGSIYKYNGSHGCINLPYSIAKYIYKYIPKGTKVIIK